MRNFRILINPFAEAELHEATEWYNIRQEHLGQRFIAEADALLARIKKNPFQFPKESKLIHKAVLGHFPYVFYFYISDDVINIFAVFHTSRNPLIWKKRFSFTIK